jgi:hypothetical protein
MHAGRKKDKNINTALHCVSPARELARRLQTQRANKGKPNKSAPEEK